MTLPEELLPRIDEINGPYFEGAAQGILRLQRCDDCSKWVFYPRVICPYCQHPRLAWQNASGFGSLYSFTTVWRAHHSAFDSEVPILFAAIELAEGPVMLSELTPRCRDAATIGMPLEVRFKEVGNGVFLPIWDTQTAIAEDV